MRHHHEDNNSRFISGILIGSALGAIIGILLAPRSGRELRETIRDGVSNRVNKGLDDLNYNTIDIREKAKDSASHLRERAQSIASELEDAGREAFEKVRKSVRLAEPPIEESPN